MAIIVPVISTIATAVLPLFLAPYVSQIFNTVHVKVNVTPNLNNDGRKALIQLTNDGTVEARNLTLVINTPKKIDYVTNLFSTSKLILPAFNQTSLEMHVPRIINEPSLEIFTRKLAAGNGSLVKIQTSIDTNQDSRFYNYSVSAVYDQGSVQGRIIGSLPTLQDLINRFYEIYGIPIVILIFSMLVYFTFFKYHMEPKALGIVFVQRIKRNLISVRRDLLDDPNNNKPFNIQTYWDDNKTYPIHKKFNIIKNIADYALIDDFYNTLKRRDKYIKDSNPQRHDAELRRFNEELITIVSNILSRENDWTK